MTKNQIIAYCVKYFSWLGKMPSLAVLKENGIGHQVVRERFGTKTELDNQAMAAVATSLLAAPSEGVKGKITKTRKRYVIVGVQNNSLLDEELMDCLDRYCVERKAELLALPIYYRNPTTLTEEKKLDDEYWWTTLPFGKYVTTNTKLGKYLTLMAEHRITATSMNPLSGLEVLAGGYSAIYANPQHQMRVIPETMDRVPHIMHTTGTVCDLSGFSHSNAGGKAKGLAVQGALVVELDGDIFHLRQLEYKEDCICDLGFVYTAKKTRPISKLGECALVWGDLHAEVLDAHVYNLTRDLSKECNITRHYLHDVLDFACQSHHNKHNFIMRYALNKNDKDSVVAAIKDVCAVVKDLTQKAEVFIVDSNHHDHIGRWLNERNFKHMDADNAYFYVCLMKQIMEAVKLNPDNLNLVNANILKHSLDIVDPDINLGITYLSRNKRHKYKGIELSQHGDVGPNGSRGSLQSFSKTSRPMVIGHSHTPGIHKRVYQVGKTAHLDQSYMRGYTSHLNSHCLIYPNGARALINIIEGKYTS